MFRTFIEVRLKNCSRVCSRSQLECNTWFFKVVGPNIICFHPSVPNIALNEFFQFGIQNAESLSYCKYWNLLCEAFDSSFQFHALNVEPPARFLFLNIFLLLENVMIVHWLNLFDMLLKLCMTAARLGSGSARLKPSPRG